MSEVTQLNPNQQLTEKQKLDQQYTQLCMQLGDLVFKRERLPIVIEDCIKQLSQIAEQSQKLSSSALTPAGS